MKIGIIHCGLGNLGSVYNAFEFYGYKVSLVKRPQDLSKSDIIVLSGVGNFSTAVIKLEEQGFLQQLQKEVIKEGKPILGICLGMQLFATVSHESGKNKGFGWLEGEVVKIDAKGMRVPRIGWGEVKPVNHRFLFDNMKYSDFYFMHSYHFVPKDKRILAGIAPYGDLDLAAAVKKGNIVGVQFHPEKSQRDGLMFIKNFVKSVT